MSLTEVAPTERFDNVAFSTEVIDGESMSIYTQYTCPRCGEVIQFIKGNFEERAVRRASNLPRELAREIDAWAAGKALAGAPFLDWLCPTCRCAARVYVRPWAGGRHGDHGVELLTVVKSPRGGP